MSLSLYITFDSLHHAGVVRVNATFIWQAKKRKSKPKDAKKKRSSAASKKKAKSGKSGKDGKKSKKQKESKSSSSESEEPETEEQKKKREAKEQEDARKKAEKEAEKEKKRLEKEEEKRKNDEFKRNHRKGTQARTRLLVCVGKKSIRSFLQNSVMIHRINHDVRNTIDAVVRYDLKLTYLYIRCIDQIKISDVRARCVCCVIS